MLNLKQLEAFAAVAQMESFSKAASILYLTQPTISSHINSLETELGVKLFIRTPQKVELTSEGHQLLELTTQMLCLEQKIRNTFATKNPKDSVSQISTVRVGASSIPAQYLITPVLAAFCEQNCNIRIELTEGDSQEVIDKLLDHKIDLGFTGTQNNDSSLCFTPIYRDTLVLITPRNKKYLAWKTRGFTIDDLYKEKIISREEGSGTRIETQKYLANIGLDWNKLHISAIFSNQEIIKKSVINNMGIAIISSLAAKENVANESLLEFPLFSNDAFRYLYLVAPIKESFPATLFAAFVRKYFSQP